jgi:uncharacterized phiE125 gp8 family phage protein
MSAIVVVTPPAVEPVTLDEAKLFCRIDGTLQDALVSGLITAAREYCEAYTRRAFITTDFRQSLDTFPYPFLYWTPSAVAYPRRSTIYEILAGRQIKLYRPPLVEVGHIEYMDNTGATQTLTPFDATSNKLGFMVDADNEPAVIFPAPATSWPTNIMLIPNCVKIFFSAGYGDASAVPGSIKTAIKQLVAHWFEHRESVTEARLQEVPQAVDLLLTPFRIMDFNYTNG